jgi:hypothetical protein
MFILESVESAEFAELIDIPVVIAHFGSKPEHLGFALKSAADFNKTVVLIGDNTNQDYWADHWDTSQITFDKFQEFQRHYQKMSDYSTSYEMAFWKRMFVLEDWLKARGYQQLFLLDSDILTFANYAKEAYPRLPPNCQASLMSQKNQEAFSWVASCHFSYWTLEALQEFTTFCIEAYKNETMRDKLAKKYQWHRDNGLTGGVCEMSLLYLWSENNPKVINFTQVIDNCTFDNSITSSMNYLDDEYQMQFGVKDFVFRDGSPYCYNKVLKKNIRFLGIHCQGRAKGLMKFLYSKQLRNFYPLANLFGKLKSSFRDFRK